MSKKGLIIINGFGVAEGIQHQLKRLKEEFSKKGVPVDVRTSTDVFSYLSEGYVKSTLPHYDFVIYTDKDRYIAEELERAGYRLFNSSSSIVKCDDKMLTHLSLSDHGIKMPTTISSPLCYRDDGNRKYLDNVIEIIGLPMIVKENYGSLGRQVYFVTSKNELLDLENKLIHVPHIFQQFIASSKGKDYRIIVIGGKAVAYMKRENKFSYLSNLATGGKSYVVDLPKIYLDVAEKAARILELDYCGVDLLEGENGEPILSEVNSNAFYEGIEKTTGINVARLYVDYILSK
ncbi:MAG: RimK family alpha-L-glutamate ligase [Bacilli bacterium]|nr:RimK family alpha-L-glutamate ligase [Bacilli bacterium]